MGKLASAGFRMSTPIPAWFTIGKKNSIPEAHRSPLNTSGRGQVGLGYVKAVCDLLTNEVIIGLQASRHALTVGYRSGGTQKVVGAEAANSGRYWSGEFGASAPARLILAEALLLDLYPDVSKDFFALYERVKKQAARPWPFSPHDLTTLSGVCDGEMMRLCDTMYFAINQLESTDEVSFTDADVGMLPPFDLSSILEPAPSRTAPQTSSFTPRLTRLVQRGGATMLLSGPSASFKSTFVRQAAADAGAALYIVQGTRSIEPIDLLGSPQVRDGQTLWVDGPVAQAMRHAQAGKTLLLIDEAMRLEPENLNAIIPMLDRIPASILPSLGLTPISDGPHFVLRLPEELVPAPCCNLSVALTTNLGSGFFQPGEALDGALETRLRYKFALERPGREVTEPIYRAVWDDPTVIEPLYALEVFTTENLLRDGGLFQDSLNVTTNLAFLEEMVAETQAGVALTEAFCDTAEFTLAPTVCPRDEYGRLEEAAFRTFMDRVRRESP